MLSYKWLIFFQALQEIQLPLFSLCSMTSPPHCSGSAEKPVPHGGTNEKFIIKESVDQDPMFWGQHRSN